MSYLTNPYYVTSSGGFTYEDATWTGNTPSYWSISDPSVTKIGGTKDDYCTAQASTTFASFICKWNGGSTSGSIVVGISTLAYITANASEGLGAGLQFGFKFKPDGSDYFFTAKDGVLSNYTEQTITSSTEFRMSLDGSDMKYYVDEVLIETETASFSGADYYLWTNANNSTTNPSWQCAWSVP